ncbi:MAG TPA: type I DNA topoisomerase [Candidatus Latescibacteria bacterium]|nr:type I DNA topoisomerase [Candidatus Latescibacterota bacterium]|tara:strand:- start:523 stop:2805 length:2283 start_codon:yes stop_codon:yes gene_type:complete
MGKSLVVVESPAKATTINKILGKDFVVKSCMGHVRDLPPKELGVDVDKNFEPRYVTIRGKGKILTELKRAAATADTIYLATDPDREGEAIAWHVAEAISPKDADIKRILFNEITPKAVRESIGKSSSLDLDKVNAQQARRVLDRLVGYEISPLLWKVIHAGLSAGRVQSVALRLICERDDEISKFEPQEYWSIDVLLGHLSGAEQVVFKSRVLQYQGEKLEIGDQETSDKIIADLKEATYDVKSVKRREQRRRPAAPFITSTLQQDAARKLRFTVKRTMAVAQQLYEGVDIGGGETVGLITYMRTDSVRISDDAITEVREQIGKQFGKEYVPEKPNVYKTRRGAQDAHEAIRATSAVRTPESMKQYLQPDQAKLYNIIWKRFVASQMEPQVLNITSVDIEAGQYTLRATGSSVKFAGFTALYTESKEEEEEEETDQVPADLKEGERLELKELLPEQHFTKPPARFSEASLVKELEAKGIGRPSTYAQIISTLQDREYVEKMDNRYFEATERGQTVTKFLVATFPNVFDVEFTAKMEDKLDRIEDGKEDWVESVRQFYGSWKGPLEEANARRKELKQSFQEQTDVVCEECGKNMVVKWGRNGRFLACPGYPQCKNTKPLEEEREPAETDEVCETCSKPMVVKTGRYGRFLACSGYPDCKNVKPFSLGITCPDCDKGEIVEKQSRKGKVFFCCNQYPTCKFASWDKPVKGPCSQCEAPILYEKASRGGTSSLHCKVCDTRIEAPETDESQTQGAETQDSQAA